MYTVFLHNVYHVYRKLFFFLAWRITQLSIATRRIQVIVNFHSSSTLTRRTMESKPLVAFQRHIPDPSDSDLNAKVLVKAKGKEYKARVQVTFPGSIHFATF